MGNSKAWIVCTVESMKEMWRPGRLPDGAMPEAFIAWATADPHRYRDRFRRRDVLIWRGEPGDEVDPIQAVYKHLDRNGDNHLPFILLIHGNREEPVRVDPRHRALATLSRI